MKQISSLLLPLLFLPTTTSFTTTPTTRNNPISMSLKPNDRVMLIGPSFLQLNIAKALKYAGLVPMIVAPQKKLDTFKQYVNDAEIMSYADIGLHEDFDWGWRTVKGVVFCSEEAVLTPDIVNQVLDWDGYADGAPPVRAVACAPLSNTISNERGMGWVPIFNNDKNEKQIWGKFLETWKNHPLAQSSVGTTIRYGNLLGGGTDGIPELQRLGLDESIYKMTLENYRDLKERSFDRYRLGAQILSGESLNPKPPNQDKLEQQGLKSNDDREIFRATGGYPEQDRACRHTVAQAVVQTLLRSGDEVPKEFTVLSKCVSALPTQEEWDEMFQNPGAAKWPDPYQFDPAKFETSMMEEK